MMINADGLYGLLSVQMATISKTTADKVAVQSEDCADNQLPKTFDTLLKQSKFVQDKNFHEDSSLMYMGKEALGESVKKTILDDGLEYLNEVMEQDSLDKIIELEISKEIVEQNVIKAFEKKLQKAKHNYIGNKENISLQNFLNPLYLVQRFIKQEKIGEKVNEYIKNESTIASINDDIQDQWVADIQKECAVEEKIQVKAIGKHFLTQQKIPQHSIQNFAHGSESLMLRVGMEIEKAQFLKNLEIGNRLIFQEEKPDFMMQLSGVDITCNKKVGDVRILHLKLTPVELGTVDAKVRMTAQGLHIELCAQHRETARLLISNQQMLSYVLEKAHIHDGGHLLISVVDKSAQVVLQNQSLQIEQDNSGQHFDGQHQAFGDNKQNGKNESKQFFKQFSLSDASFLDIPLEDISSRTSYRLVV
ncbi:flagellar hook-length control protein FliK [Bartonella bilalgolemii]|uniref:Flagellar hook-length control protein FliK n=1 Tax=Bartonella bilalgolemii TaxID=2942911 RepID=A0ABT0P7L7_9HYPH|nr:flagellar hook-length control protein FliK [Bartonella sp. G70]MCL6229461.1 flagellar hook-length control protein FliK [Bartonella sp. G70]